MSGGIDRINGYGFALNELVLIDGVLYKRHRENAPDEAAEKISNEVSFYNHLDDNTRSLFPAFYGMTERGYKMAFIPDAVPLFRVMQDDASSVRRLHGRVRDLLDILHRSRSAHVPASVALADIRFEMKEKVLRRMSTVQRLVSQHTPRVSTVNGSAVCSQGIEETLEILFQRFIGHIDKEGVEYHMIHGDPQFNNVLCTPGESLFLIDPRGRFGHTRVMGLRQYDDAKLLFALSGYDRFDQSTITGITLMNDGTEIALPPWMKPIDDALFREEWERQPFTRLLFYTIWLGNAHMFASDQPFKALCSYYYALLMLSLEPN